MVSLNHKDRSRLNETKIKKKINIFWTKTYQVIDNCYYSDNGSQNAID